jgi:hypothetical protein
VLFQHPAFFLLKGMLMKENTSVSYYCVLLYLFYCNNNFFIDFCNSNVTDDISQDNLVEEPISLTPTSSGFFRRTQ